MLIRQPQAHPRAEVSCGGAFTAAVAEGQLWAWGSNEEGQLARPPGDPQELDVPARVETGDVNFTYVACGSAHALAVDMCAVYHSADPKGRTSGNAFR